MPCEICGRPQGRKAYNGLCAKCRREFKRLWHRYIVPLKKAVPKAKPKKRSVKKEGS